MLVPIIYTIYYIYAVSWKKFIFHLAICLQDTTTENPFAKLHKKEISWSIFQFLSFVS